MRIKPIKWLGLALIGLTACYDFSNFENVNVAVEPFSPSFILPVINDTITLKEILEQSDSISLIQENPDNSFSILFRDTLDAGFATDQFSIPDQVFIESFTVPAIPPTPSLPAGSYGPFTQEFNETVETTTEAGGVVELKRIDFSSGTLQIQLSNTFNHSVDIHLSLTSLKDNLDDTLELDINLTAFGTANAQYNNSINLVDYYFDCYHPTLDIYNAFSYDLTATLISSGGSINVGDNIDIRVSVTNPSFDKITGKINYTFDQTNQSYNVGVAQNTLDMEQHLEDPKISLKFLNSYGVPISASFPQFQLNNSDNLPLNLVSDRNNVGDLQVGNANTNVITPAATSQTITTTNFVLNRDNSNIENAFDIAPTEINFGTTFSVGDNTDNHDYFVDQSSTIQLLSEIEVPIYGYVMVSLSDTLNELDLPDLDSIGIKDAEISLFLKITNQIPFDIFLQVSFVDDTYTEITKLFDNVADKQLITSPTVDGNGVSNSTAVTYTEIKIDQAKFELMSQATNAILKFRFALGSDTQSVKVLSTNSMGIQANFQFKGTVKPKL